MKSLYINPTGDIEFDARGELKLIGGKDELVQSVRQIIKTNVNEWFLNPSLGFDYSTVFVKKPNEEEITNALIEALTQDERIERVEDIKIEFDRKERNLTVFFTAISNLGQISEVVEV